MKNTLKFGNQTIYTASSEDMHHLSDKSIDVIITSPPYNVGKEYSNKFGTFDDNKNYSDYLGFLNSVFSECYRVASNKCVFFLNIGDSASDQGKSEDVVRIAEQVGFKRLQTVIWLKSIFGKGHYTPTGGNRRLNNLWEYVFILVKSKQYQLNPKAIGIPYSDKSNLGRYSDVDLRDAGDVWFIPYSKTTGKTIKKGHEAPFPVELPLTCLKLIPEIKTVLDPFAGTGSTLRAAEELNLTGYGYELYPRPTIIAERMKMELELEQTPLLPQLMFYADFMEKKLDECLTMLTPTQIKKLCNIKRSEQQKLIWTCLDLNKKTNLLTYFDQQLINSIIQKKYLDEQNQPTPESLTKKQNQSLLSFLQDDSIDNKNT